MEPDFQKALLIVLIGGTLVVAAGTVTLYIVFRRFEGPKAGGQSHMGLMAGLIAFIFLACAALFAVSYMR